MKKKIIISYLIGIITMLIIGSVGATILYNAKDIEYKDTNVEDAIDDLYNKYNYLKKPTLYLLRNGAYIDKDSNGDYFIGFDGSNDYVEIEPLPATINWSDGFVVEFTAEWNALNSWSRIIDIGNGQASDNFLIANSGTSTNIRTDIYNQGTSQSINLGSGDVITLNKKINYKIEYIKLNNGKYNIKVYLDGKLSNEIEVTLMFRNVNRNTNYLGKSNWADAYFKGKIYKISIKQADGKKIIDIDLNREYK